MTVLKVEIKMYFTSFFLFLGKLTQNPNPWWFHSIIPNKLRFLDLVYRIEEESVLFCYLTKVLQTLIKLE